MTETDNFLQVLRAMYRAADEFHHVRETQDRFDYGVMAVKFLEHTIDKRLTELLADWNDDLHCYPSRRQIVECPTTNKLGHVDCLIFIEDDQADSFGRCRNCAKRIEVKRSEPISLHEFSALASQESQN